MGDAKFTMNAGQIGKLVDPLVPFVPPVRTHVVVWGDTENGDFSIYAVEGLIAGIADIEKEVNENADDYLVQGDGDYMFNATFVPESVQVESYWEIQFITFRPTVPTALQCPFCGNNPVVQLESVDYQDQGKGHVECHGHDCLVNPHVSSGFSKASSDDAFIVDAVKKWNKRHKPFVPNLEKAAEVVSEMSPLERLRLRDALSQVDE